MNKKKKISIMTAAILLFTSGVGYTLLKKKQVNYNNYVTNAYNTIKDDSLLLCAHRGFSSMKVENTMDAILLAANYSYIDYIEMDVRLTNDGKLILSHDKIIYDENKKPVDISKTNYKDLKEMLFLYNTTMEKNSVLKKPEDYLFGYRLIELNNKKYKLIGLKEGINYCQDKKILLDIKFDNNIELLTNELIKELKNADREKIIIQSFSQEGIKYIKENTDFNCAPLISNKEGLDDIDDFNIISLKYSLTDEELIKKLLDDGKIVFLWTVNNSIELEYVLKKLPNEFQNVIYITNYPDLIYTKLYEEKVKKLNKV